MQLLGVEGMIEIVESENPTEDEADKLLSLNFLRDECARTTRLYLEPD